MTTTPHRSLHYPKLEMPGYTVYNTKLRISIILRLFKIRRLYMDNLSKADRRKNMQNICSKNTHIERIMFDLLKKHRINFKKHYKTFGMPDIAIPDERIAVFLDSDFWHGWHFSKWKRKLPKVYWRNKIERNIRRDISNFAKLRRREWKVLRIWEHQIKKDPEACADRIAEAIRRKK